MYENNNQGEKDLSPARIDELKRAGWSVPLDKEAVEDGARNIRLNADKAALVSAEATRTAAEAVATATAATGALSEITTWIESAENSTEQIRGSIATHETRLQASERAITNNARWNIVSPGRPDKPQSLEGATQLNIASAPVGATFTSTDGANVGAYQWLRTSSGWICTHLDTGWRNIGTLPALKENFKIRRMGNICYISSVSNTVTVTERISADYVLPNGFIPASRSEILITKEGISYSRILLRPNDRTAACSSKEASQWCALNGATWVTDNQVPDELPGTPA